MTRRDRKNVFVTGPPRCGKSTLMEKLIERIEKPTIGFFTRQITERGQRVGFSITTLDGKEGVLAHVNMKGRFRVGKYTVNLLDIDQIAVPSMLPSTPDDVVVVDEVGKMECFSPIFKQVLMKLLDSDHQVIGSIAEKGDKFIQEIKARDDVLLFNVSAKNRDTPELFSGLLAALG
ncbi:MAG: AAA family ATPase [Deltaproteobacteria bacterium]|nr:AAA family ATPase [Deltaproteobacteria bacterium]